MQRWVFHLLYSRILDLPLSLRLDYATANKIYVRLELQNKHFTIWMITDLPASIMVYILTQLI